MGVLLALRLLKELSSLVKEKKCFRAEGWDGLEFGLGVTTGTGRNIDESKSRVIPGGPIKLEGEERAMIGAESEETEETVGIDKGGGSLLAYCRSSLERDGDGRAIRMDREERPEEPSDL